MDHDEMMRLVSKRDEILTEQLGNVIARLEELEEILSRCPANREACGARCLLVKEETE